jgi:hypothetical protein
MANGVSVSKPGRGVASKPVREDLDQAPEVTQIEPPANLALLSRLAMVH